MQDDEVGTSRGGDVEFQGWGGDGAEDAHLAVVDGEDLAVEGLLGRLYAEAVGFDVGGWNGGGKCRSGEEGCECELHGECEVRWSIFDEAGDVRCAWMASFVKEGLP